MPRNQQKVGKVDADSLARSTWTHGLIAIAVLAWQSSRLGGEFNNLIAIFRTNRASIGCWRYLIGVERLDQ